jgi:hypothetical protein
MNWKGCERKWSLPGGHGVFRSRFEPNICGIKLRSVIESDDLLSDIAVEWLVLIFRV